MTHPDHLVVRRLLEERAALGMELRAPELGGAGALDPPAEVARHELHPVADAERRDAELPQTGIDLGSVVRVDRGGAAAEHDRARVPCPERLRRRPVRDELGVDAALADPTRDELRVLPAEVDDEDRPVLGLLFGPLEGQNLGHIA